MVKELEGLGALSERQYGFREGRSTLSALETVGKWMEEASAKWSILVALDVRNAFNTASWRGIVETLVNLEVSPYLVDITRNYLRYRRIHTRRNRVSLSAGVSQGSVLGPVL